MLTSIFAAMIVNIVLFIISMIVFRLIKNKPIDTTMQIWVGAMFLKLILLLLFILFIAKPNNLLTSAFGIAFGMFLFAFLMIEILILNKQKI